MKRSADVINALEKMTAGYAKTFPELPLLVYNKGWIYGVWMIGNNYEGSGYHGACPPTYLTRIHAMFSPLLEKGRILHLFSGSIIKGG